MHGRSTVGLKIKHSLNGKNKIVTEVRKLRKEEEPQQLARVRINVETEDMDEREMKDSVKTLIGDDPNEI